MYFFIDFLTMFIIFYTLNIFWYHNFTENAFFSKKSPCGKIHTRQNMFLHFYRKKCPCGKIHTRQSIFKHFNQKKLRGNSHTAQRFVTISMILNGFSDLHRFYNDLKWCLLTLYIFNITFFQKTFFFQKNRPLRENAHTAKGFLTMLKVFNNSKGFFFKDFR